ncbi:hypothetical protein D3C72_1638870 [compost metagenome]
MEDIGQQRGAEDEAHLVARHAHFQLGQHLFGDKVALLNVRTVGREKPHEFLQRRNGGRLCALFGDQFLAFFLSSCRLFAKDATAGAAGHGQRDTDHACHDWCSE